MANSKRMAELDSVRAIAALLVVVAHAAEQLVSAAPLVSNRWLYELTNVTTGGADIGRIGVVLFFCLSGYVIPQSLARRDARAGRDFVVRRFFRLYPAFWLSIAASCLLIWPVMGEKLAAWEIVANLTMIPDAFGARAAIGLYWTLAYELFFYFGCLVLWGANLLNRPLCWPVLSYICLGVGAVFLLISIFPTRFAPGDIATVALNLSALCLGAWWRRSVDQPISSYERSVMAVAFGGVIVVLPVACLALVYGLRFDNPWYIWICRTYCIAILLFVLLTRVLRIRWRVMAWLGVVSYSLYLFHPIVLYPLVAVLKARSLLQIDLLVWTALAGVLSVGVAALVFRFVEAPAIAAGRWIVSADRSARVAASGSV